MLQLPKDFIASVCACPGFDEAKQTFWINNLVGKVCSVNEQQYSDIGGSNFNRFTLKLISFQQ